MPASSPRCACSHSRTPLCVSCCKSAVRTRSATLRKMRIFTTGVKPSGSLMRLPLCRRYGLPPVRSASSASRRPLRVRRQHGALTWPHVALADVARLLAEKSRAVR